MLKVTSDVANTAIKHKEKYTPILKSRFSGFKQRVQAHRDNPTSGRLRNIIVDFRTPGLDMSTFDIIEDFIDANTEFLLVSEPQELLDFSNRYNNEKKKRLLPELAYKGIEYVFEYKYFSENSTSWNAYRLINQLKVTVCPYCNRGYIFTVDATATRKGVRPEIDHFFCQKVHPILSVSFYNLIPSCHTCNHTKRDEEFTHIKNLHPYFDGISIGDLIFDFDATSATPATIDAEDVSIRMLKLKDSKLRDKFDANKNAFILEDLYSLHKEDAARIIRLSVWYDDNSRASLKTILNMNSDDDIDSMIIGTRLTQEDLLNHPLSKFSHDIFRQCRNKSHLPRQRLKIST